MSSATEVYDLKARAKEWVDGVNAATGLATGWRLQILRLRTKRKFGKDSSALPEPDTAKVDSNGGNPVSVEHTPETGECPDLPVLIRRFVPGCPWELVDEAVRYLHRIAPYRDVIYNGIPVQGVYRPISTTWQRDEQTLSPGERGSLGTYTLVQDLVEITACPDELESLTSSSCQSDEETTFVWDADSVDAPPATCEQGVTWEVRAVSRDENGQFSYQLVKRTAKTRAWGPRTIECGEMSSTEEWGWRNAYGDPSTGVIEVRACGSDTPVAVQLPGCDEPGVTTQVNTELNPDCTWDVVVRRRTSKPVSESWTEGTSCRPRSTVLYENSRGVPSVPSPAPGETVSANFRLNDDRTVSGTVSVSEAPDPVSWEWTDGPVCRPVRHTVMQDQKSRPALPAIAPGETLNANISRTEDCLWNASFAVTPPTPPFAMDWREGSVCRPVDVTVREGELSAPSPSEFTPPQGGGTVTGRVTRNADCTFDWNRSVTAPESPWSFAWTEGSPCSPRSVTEFSGLSEPPRPPVPAAGETVAHSVSRAGDCTYSGRTAVSSNEPWTDSWTDGTQCRTRSTTVWRNWLERPAIPRPGRGESVDANLSRNDDCTYSGSVQVVSAEEPFELRWTDGTRCAPVSHVAYSSQASVPSVPAARPGYTVDASLRRDSDCTYSGVVSVRQAPESVVSWEDGTGCRPSSHTVYDNVKELPSVPAPGVGVSVAARLGMNADCTYSGEVVSTRNNPDDTGWITWQTVLSDGRTQTHGYRSFEGLSSFSSVLPSGRRMASANISVSRDGMCTYSGQASYSSVPEGGSGGAGADMKFIRHGPSIPIHIYDHDPYKGRHAYRVATLHATFHYGDAYTDFVSDKLRASGRPSEEDPSGVVAARLAPGYMGHSIWTDSGGNVVCAWVSVEYNRGAYDNWTDIRSRAEMRKFKELMGSASKNHDAYESILQSLLSWN